MVGGDIHDNSYVAVIESKPRADDAAACRFEHGNIDGRVFQNKLSRNRSGIIALNDLLVPNISSVCSRKANRSPAPSSKCGRSIVWSSFCRSYR